MNRVALENARTLGHVLGTTPDAATSLLDRCVLITSEVSGMALGVDVGRLLSRSVREVTTEASSLVPAVEVVIGSAPRRTCSKPVYISISCGRVRIASEPDDHAHVDSHASSLLLLVTACYAAGAVIRRLVGAALPYPAPDPIIFSWDDLLGEDEGRIGGRVDLGLVHLAGAGAVGNAFLLALGRLNVEGDIFVVDPDVVEEGNLNRTLLFDEDDIGKPKASALVYRAASLLPNVRLAAHNVRLQELARSSAWLEQLVCTVDSRRARRALQEELPHDVYDASTSGIADVVLHFNSVAERGACLSCVYHEDRREALHEEHVATMLGITAEEVRRSHLTEAAVQRVLAKHPHLAGRQLVGLACDTLFKELCATGDLGGDSGQQVLAPLAFVSALAGTLLALEFVRRRARGTATEPYNDWHLSPWGPPLVEGRRSRPPREGCTFCGCRGVRAAFATLWQVGDEPSSHHTEDR